MYYQLHNKYQLQTYYYSIQSGFETENGRLNTE